MEKGKLGIRVSVYAVLAFIFAAFGLDLGIVALFAVVLIAEKDEWATRQTLQALLLCLVPNIIGIFFRGFDFIGWFSWSRLYIISTVWSRITSVINWGVDIFVYVFAFLAILNVSKGKEAGIPLISNFANWAYGKVVVKPQTICWDCRNAVGGGCSWFTDYTPVAGWKAVKTELRGGYYDYESYLVQHCPEFVDDRRKA